MVPHRSPLNKPQRLSELVEVWRHAMLNAFQDIQANQEQSLAELRYLKQKVDRLDERTLHMSTTGSPEKDSTPRRRRGHFRDSASNTVLTADLGVPPRFSSLPASSHLNGSILPPPPPPEYTSQEQHTPTPAHRFSLAPQLVTPSTPKRVDSLLNSPVKSVRLVKSPGNSIRRQVERAIREADEIEEGMQIRREVSHAVLEPLYRD